MLIREAHASDAMDIARLHAASWRSTYRGMLDDAYLDGPVEDERLALWRERFAHRPVDQHVVVAESAGQLCGFACAYGQRDARWGTLLDNLHVARDRKRQGVGSGLLRAVASWCVRADADPGLHLWVIEPNLGARRFYERLGAELAGRDVWSAPGGGSVPRLRLAWQHARALL